MQLEIIESCKWKIIWNKTEKLFKLGLIMTTKLLKGASHFLNNKCFFKIEIKRVLFQIIFNVMLCQVTLYLKRETIFRMGTKMQPWDSIFDLEKPKFASTLCTHINTYRLGARRMKKTFAALCSGGIILNIMFKNQL